MLFFCISFFLKQRLEIGLPLFRNKRFMLDKMTRRSASKFAAFYIRKPKVTISVFLFLPLYFFPNECPGLC